MTSSHMPGYETHARHSPSITFQYASEGTQSQSCYFKSASASMHTIQEVSTNASIHTSLQTVQMLHLPSCAKEGFRGKIGNFCFTLTQTLHSLGVCITQEEIYFFSVQIAATVQTAVAQMTVRYTSTVFLFYSTNLAKIKAYRELPTSAKSLQKVLFLNTPYVILNTKKSQSSFSGKTDFYPQLPKLPELQAWKSRQAPVCTAMSIPSPKSNSSFQNTGMASALLLKWQLSLPMKSLQKAKKSH